MGVYPSCAHSRDKQIHTDEDVHRELDKKTGSAQDSEPASELLELLKFFIRLPADGSQRAVAWLVSGYERSRRLTRNLNDSQNALNTLMWPDAQAFAGGNVTVNTEERWFVLMVRSRWEKCAAQCLARKGFECLLPISKQRHRWSDRWKELEVVLFPGYLFCRLDPERRLPVLSVPGVLSIVGTRTGLTPVGPDEIAAVEMVARAGVPAQPWPFVETGQVVYLDQGPLRGLTGIVLERKHESKLIISVQLLKRSIAVEIDRTWISTLPVQCRQGVVGALNVSPLDFEQGELSASQ